MSEQGKAERIAAIKQDCDKTPFHFATIDNGWLCDSCKAKIKAIEEEGK